MGVQSNAAFYRIVIVRMRFHQPTIDYVTRRAGTSGLGAGTGAVALSDEIHAG